MHSLENFDSVEEYNFQNELLNLQEYIETEIAEDLNKFLESKS